MTRSPLTFMVILYFKFIQLTKKECDGNSIKSNKHLLSVQKQMRKDIQPGVRVVLMESREIMSTYEPSAVLSLQDGLFHNPSFLVNCKVIILWIIQSFFYTLVQVLQGDEVLCLFLFQKKPTGETE